MLNIEDIIRLNREEPKEVAAIRENIIKAFSNLEFIEDGHKYILHDKDGDIPLKSVSETCHKFEPYADWEEITARYALKHGRTIEDVKREWEENNLKSTNNGTSTHLFGENYMYFIMNRCDMICDVIKPQFEKGYLVPYGGKQEAVAMFYEDLLKAKNVYPVMAESKVHSCLDKSLNLKENFSGTFDMLFAYKHKDKWKLLVYDFKTNKNLYSDYNRNNNIMLVEEFSDMVNEPLSLYTLQLSCYSLCLMQLGYEIADRKIIWLKEDGYEKISLPDVTERLKKAL